MEQSNPEEVDSAVTTDANRVFEENPIIEVFDDPANLRILITLIDAGGQGLPPSNLAERANVDGMTIKENEALLVKYGLLIVEREDNRDQYRVELDNPQIQKLTALYDSMADLASQ